MNPSAGDWEVVGRSINDVHNRIRRQVGLKSLPYMGERRLPTDAELDAWEQVCPGSRAKLEQMARNAMERRQQSGKVDQVAVGLIWAGVAACLVWASILLYMGKH